MPKKMALIRYQDCSPDECEKGICQAVVACPKKLLRQEEAYEMPDPNPNMCLGCGLCVKACPRKAVILV
jgi:translation initiation factor RLI1